MNIRQRFATEGLVVFYRAVPESQTNLWRSLARQPNFWSSQLLDNVVEDTGRVQTLVADEEARDMSRILRRCYRTFIPDSDANEWRLVKTIAGTGDLPPRRDFPTWADAMDVGANPGGIVVATDDDTYFYVYGWDHTVALRSDRRLITLHKGDVLVYRGDLIYAPVGYNTNNVCLHAYLDSPTSERPDDHQPIIVPTYDDTVPSDDPFCFVWNCTFRGNDALAVRRHLNRYHNFRFHHAPPVAEP